MKAVQINAYGGGDVLELRDIPKSVPAKGQVLVEVYASNINPVDWKLRAGYLKEWRPIQFPAVLGGDFAGVVTELGEGVSEFKVGDEAYGSAFILNGGSGAYAEFAVANAANVSLKPKSVSFEEAAALPLVGSSAVQGLEEHMKLGPAFAKASADTKVMADRSGGKQKILIHGGAGGIGHVAIQLAKALGAYVITTVSEGDREFVKGLGADEVVDYKAQKFEEIVKDCSGVFDIVGGEVTNKSFQVLKKGGVLVTIAGMPDMDLAKAHGAIAIRQGTDVNAKHLSRLAELVGSGKIKVHVDRIFPLEQIKEAFDYQEKQSPRGKVVLRVRVTET